MGLSDRIVDKANELYLQVTKGQIYRGESRKAVIFACVYHAYKLSGKCQTPNTLMSIFGLSKKNSLRGLKIVSVNLPKSSITNTYSLTPVHHIKDILSQFDASEVQQKEVQDLYTSIKNRSSKLNRARPQSVAAALIYYWIIINEIDISLRQFAKQTDLSELTINKNVREIQSIINRKKD